MQTLLLIALLAAAPAQAEHEEDFREDFEGSTPGLALGPLASGQFLASLDLGWPRSALRGQVGLGRAFDFVFWGDAFLLDDLFDQQNGLHLGLRYTPLHQGPFRLSIEGTVGAIFIADGVTTSNLFAFRGEVTAGVTRASLGTLYGRLQLRGLTDAAAGDAHWGHDGELGVGVERNLRRITVGAEAAWWTRPDLDAIRQWRIRVGYRL